MDEGGVNVIVISKKAFAILLKNTKFNDKWDCLDPNVTESLAHTKVTESILDWCAIRIYRIDWYNGLREVRVERNLLDGFLLTIAWEPS